MYRCIYCVSGTLYAGCQSIWLCRRFGCLCCYHNAFLLFLFFLQHTGALLLLKSHTKWSHEKKKRKRKGKKSEIDIFAQIAVNKDWWMGRHLGNEKFAWQKLVENMQREWNENNKICEKKVLGSNGKLFTVVPKWCNFACSCNSISCRRKPASLYSPIEVKHSFPTPSSSASLKSRKPPPFPLPPSQQV